MNNSEKDSKKSNIRNKVYRKPVLVKFGSVQELTAGASGSTWDSSPQDGRPA